ncbi:MAG TPA: YihY/virulence factor BrkB family protein [Thermoanaerobaculia bacterium]
MKTYLGLFKQTFQEFGQDKAPRLGAALAYYTVFSIGPLLLIAIAIAGLVWGEEAAQGQISTQLKNVLGENVASSVETMVAGAGKEKSGIIATIIGVATLMFGASGVFGQLKDALDTIWNVEPKKSEGIMGFIKDRFLSMAMVLGVGFLLLVSLVLDAVIAGMGGYLGRIVGGEAVLHVIQLVLSYVMVTVLLAAIFKFLPDIKITWRDVWLGALFTSVLFVLGKYALGLYLGRAAVGSSYGAAGSLVILLIWVYYSAQIVFFGAEFTQVYTRQRGSLKGDTSKAEAKATADRVEDRPKSNEEGERRPTPAPAPAYARQAVPAGGGAAKLAAGGAAGLVVGTLLGGITAAIVTVKSIKKLLTAPFK